MTYEIRGSHNPDIDFRGGNRDFLLCHDPEVIIHGPAETGKTYAACWKVHIIAAKNPNASLAIVRKTQKSIYGSVLETFQDVIEGAPVEVYGGRRPEKYIYPNGAEIWIGGMDNPDKILSSERDLVYVNQAEELTLDDWEKLTTRTTGRGAVIEHPQLIGDANPAGSRHWIRTREGLTLIPSRHVDNPTLFTEDGTITPQGEKTLSQLKRLTGVRYKRLYEGVWATAEGAVYDNFLLDTHVKERDDSEFVRWYLAQDEGFTNPQVILRVGEDADGRWHIAQEWYETGKLQEQVVKQSLEMAEGVSLVAVDAAAAGLIAALRNAGLPAKKAKGRVLDGIWHIQDRLKVQGDGLPRLTVDPACVNVINEFESYIWKPGKDEPQKENDHAMDAIRYLDDVAGVTYTDLVAFV